MASCSSSRPLRPPGPGRAVPLLALQLWCTRSVPSWPLPFKCCHTVFQICRSGAREGANDAGTWTISGVKRKALFQLANALCRHRNQNSSAVVSDAVTVVRNSSCPNQLQGPAALSPALQPSSMSSATAQHQAAVRGTTARQTRERHAGRGAPSRCLERGLIPWQLSCINIPNMGQPITAVINQA